MASHHGFAVLERIVQRITFLLDVVLYFCLHPPSTRIQRRHHRHHTVFFWDIGCTRGVNGEDSILWLTYLISATRASICTPQGETFEFIPMLQNRFVYRREEYAFHCDLDMTWQMRHWRDLAATTEQTDMENQTTVIDYHQSKLNTSRSE